MIPMTGADSTQEQNIESLSVLKTGCVAAFLLAFGLCAFPIVKAFLFPSGAKYPMCSTNIKILANGMLMYAEDHSGKLPPARFWATAIGPYVKDPDRFHCPESNRLSFSYSFNSLLGGKKLDSIRSPDKVALLFESAADQQNASDPVTSFSTPHHGFGAVAFVDGRVKMVRTAPLSLPQGGGKVLK